MQSVKEEIVKLTANLQQVPTNTDERNVLLARLGIAQLDYAEETNNDTDFHRARYTLEEVLPELDTLSNELVAARAFYSLAMIESHFNSKSSSNNLDREIEFLKLAANKFDAGRYPDWATQSLIFWAKTLTIKGINNRDNVILNEARKILEKASVIVTFTKQFDMYQESITNDINELEYISMQFEPEKPTCFISYSWDNDAHKKWVRELANDIERFGIKVKLDQKDELEISDLAQYMEESIRLSDLIILVCTPQYKKKADSGKSGVGYEKCIITGEILTNASHRTKFLPIIRNGSPSESLPSFIATHLWYDFRDDCNYDEQITTIAKRVFQGTRNLEESKQGEKGHSKRNRINYINDNSQQSNPKYPKHVKFDFRYRLDMIRNYSMCNLEDQTDTSLQIVDINISNECSWYRDWGILKRYEFSDTEGWHPDKFPVFLKQFYEEARWHFQQGASLSKKLNLMRMKDPILDITTMNKADRPEIVFSVGICPLAVWAIPKEIPQPRIISVSDRYYLPCRFDKLFSQVAFENPLQVTSNGIWRFELCLVKLSEELYRFGGNECLVSLVINFGQPSCLISPPLYLGVVG
jgi:hypothetical protein